MGCEKSARWSKIPTAQDIAKFDGMHCKNIYAEAVRTGWRCPSCHRTAHELIRWTEIKGPYWRTTYGDEFGMGFTISLTKHHCHGSGRFATTLICGDCNSADGAAKRKLKLPPSWSYSPEELSKVVKASPHCGKTDIDFPLAHTLYLEAQTRVSNSGIRFF